eukprot:TRINITY_DN23095_c0_g3_i1.p1 TRINITY_DN23095_c0_g3~~TRINITY_DN23095_c0_g3_i1.p1  ORF type:complete len:664 (+),score=114.55 TRINITY_DN23095_c0_g3_i1:61-2052(+)
MGSGVGKGRKYKSKEEKRKGKQPWSLPVGGCVVATVDFDPTDAYWPPAWGEPLRLRAGQVIRILRDDGDERAYGQVCQTPEWKGFLLKQHVTPVSDDASTTASTWTGGTRSQTSSSSPAPSDVSPFPSSRRSFPSDTVPSTTSFSRPWQIVAAPKPAGGSMFAPLDDVDAQRLRVALGHGSSSDPGSFMQPPSIHVSTTDRMPLVSNLNPGTTGVQSSDSYVSTTEDLAQPHTAAPTFSNKGIRVARGMGPPTVAAPRLDARKPPAAPAKATRAQSQPQATRVFPPDVLATAKELGIDENHMDAFGWIAERAAHAELPSGWVQFHDDDGRPAFYNEKLKRVTRQHPMITRFKRFVDKTMKLAERSENVVKKLRPHVGVFLNEIMNRCHRNLPPVTPEIIERLAVLLNINVALDHRLTKRIKATIDLYAEDQYDMCLAAHQKVDVDRFIAAIREEQLAVEVFEKPEGSIMCSEIDGLPATLKCEQCMDHFSAEGFARTHRGGKRLQHTTLRCEQVVCSVYPLELASVEVDNMLFCERAYEECCHKNPSLRQKKRRLLGGIRCSEHPERKAEVLCEECSDFFCWEAFVELHNKGNRQRHVALKLDADGTLRRGREPVPPEETSRLLERARVAREGGPWLAFSDDQYDTYWYHLSDKIVTTLNPYL